MKKILLFLFVLCMSCFYTVYAQTISGIVTSAEDGSPLPGANVQEKGTNIGAITDLNGAYSIKISSNNSVLVFSLVGYKPHEIAYSGNSNINVALETEAFGIDEVVVVGYGTMRKSDLTGSVAKVNVEDIRKVSTIDAAHAIQGRLAGVNVISNSGNPGSGVTIRVRGIGTINNSNPLFVVDGFPLGDISHIAPTDIESMEVLKDASATAIYGSRGANGVILVKTRSGTKNKMEVHAGVLTGISQETRRLDLADAYQFANARSKIGKTDDIINFVLVLC
jgi:TonB-dependent starch-binding outer membrane protein SusC